MSAYAALRNARRLGCRLSVDGGSLIVDGPLELPEPVLEALRQNKPALLLWLRLHPQLRYALPRELWRSDDRRAFLLDTSVRSLVPLVDAHPKGIDPDAWRAAVAALNRTILPGMAIPKDYDAQPILKFKVNPPEIDAGRSDLTRAGSGVRTGGS
jgi:hypothetical protein